MVRREGSSHPNWKGGRQVATDGYIWIWTGNGKRIQEHRLIIEEEIGRSLDRFEIVHHKNGNKQDNRRENLELMTLSEHTIHHWTGRKHSSESIEKNRQSNLGKKRSLETRQKIRVSRLGTKHRPESIEKMRRSKLSRRFPMSE